MTELILIILQLFTGVLAGYLIHYVRQKAKNQAQLEDIKELTESVQEVKQRFTKETDYLRAELQVLTSKKSLIFTEEKEAIVEFFAKYNQWLWDGLQIPVAEYGINNYQKIQEKLIEMDGYYNQTNIAYSKIQLLIKDETLVGIGHSLITKTADMHLFCSEILRELQIAILDEKVLMEEKRTEGLTLREMPGPTKDYYLREAKMSKEARDKAVNRYAEEKATYHKSAYHLRDEFMKHARDYLNK